MTASERTKQLLANGLKEISATTALRKIRVGELCDRCGVDRRTFYYHFKDIYDLAAWIFDQDMHIYLPLRSAGTPTVRGLTGVLSRFREQSVFYRCALAEDSQNALGRHFLQATVSMYTALILKKQGKNSLSEEESFAVGYHCFGAFGMIRRWLFTEPDRTPEEIAGYLLNAMPPFIRCLYETEQEESK